MTQIASHLHGLYLHYTRLKDRCTLALLVGFVAMCAALILFGVGMACLSGEISDPSTAALLFALSSLACLIGVVAGKLYLRWFPKRDYALQQYQAAASIDYW